MATLTSFASYLRSSEHSERTITEYVRTLTRLERELGPLDQVSLADWRAWRDQRHERVRLGEISPAKPRSEYQTLSKYFEWLIERRELEINPMRMLKTFKRQAWKPRPMSKDGLARLFDHVMPRPNVPDLFMERLRNRAIVSLLFNGLRNQEAATLRTDHLIVSRTDDTMIVRVHGKGRHGKPKIAEVPMQKMLAEYVAEYVVRKFLVFEQEPASWLMLLDEALRRRLLTSRPLFYNAAGAPLSRRDLNRLFQTWRDAAEIGEYTTAHGRVRPYSPHSLRHAFGSYLLENGVDIRVIQELMRHSSIQTTQYYTEVPGSLAARSVQALTIPKGSV